MDAALTRQPQRHRAHEEFQQEAFDHEQQRIMVAATVQARNRRDHQLPKVVGREAPALHAGGIHETAQPAVEPPGREWLAGEQRHPGRLAACRGQHHLRERRLSRHRGTPQQRGQEQLEAPEVVGWILMPPVPKVCLGNWVQVNEQGELHAPSDKRCAGDTRTDGTGSSVCRGCSSSNGARHRKDAGLAACPSHDYEQRPRGLIGATGDQDALCDP